MAKLNRRVETKVLYLKASYKPGTMAHVYNPSTQGKVDAGGLSWVIYKTLSQKNWREEEYLYQKVAWFY